MCGGIFLGILGGALVAKLILRRRGCGRGPWGGGWRGGRWGRHHGHGPHGGAMDGMAIGWISRRLGLDPMQEAEVEGLWLSIRDDLMELRQGGRSFFDQAIDAVTCESFDRAAVEAAATQQGQNVDRLRGRIVEGLQRLHDLLTPEQRQRLKSIRGGWRFGGPYR